MNWMPINVRMEQPVLEYHPMIQVLAFPDTIDMVVVFVMQQQQLLVDNISQQLMVVVLLVDLDRLLQQRQPHTAKHQCTADRHTIFGMRHSYLEKCREKNAIFFIDD